MNNSINYQVDKMHSLPDNAVWKAREHIIFIGWKFCCFDELHGEIIGKIFPALHVTNPFRAKIILFIN